MDDEIFQCYECADDGVQVFASEEALIAHKWDMIRTSKRKSHMCCHICKLDHRTFEGLVRHYQLNHPAKQKLRCPGCDAPFVRLYLLMQHLDGNACPHILASRVSENRVLQVQATNLVAAAAAKGALEGSTEDRLFKGYSTEDTTSASAHFLPGVVATETARSAQLGIFDASGVTLGDFGRFVGIDPLSAASVVQDETAAAAAANVGGIGWALSVGLGGADQLGQNYGNDQAVPVKRETPQSSDDAIRQMMIQRQRQMDFGGSTDLDRQHNVWKKVRESRHSKLNIEATQQGPPVSMAVAGAVRKFRHGDSKAPDLLTDDLSAVNQRSQGLNVWAGQEMLETEPLHQRSLVHGGGSQRNTGTIATTTLPTSVSSVSDQLSLTVGSHSACGSVSGESFTTLKNDGASKLCRQAPLTIDHPDHPRFNVFRYKNKISGRFNCPNELCQRAGKVFKTAGALIGHLRNDTVHSTLRVQCPSCFSFFTSVNALLQHCESQSSRCQFRESDDYLPFLNILTAGVAEVQGRNIDMTLAYDVQPSAPLALLQDEIYQGESTDRSKALW
ncbi:hypothetical protein SEPCBS119000_003693 [Sporothrix epigloea]|uniref:C2H2-type domain-containing protein n=1 Tax=Sporothrix epigloea TaxID=1892477 RepID=A0ABP0DN11_9PEZI